MMGWVSQEVTNAKVLPTNGVGKRWSFRQMIKSLKLHSLEPNVDILELSPAKLLAFSL